MRRNRFLAVTYGLILGGLTLSVLSYYQWCATEGCSRLHGAHLFGVSLEVWGGVFFLLLGILTALSRNPWVNAVRRAVLAGAVGAEATLIGIQWSLQEVCLLCMGIAGVVAALGALEAIQIAAAARGRSWTGAAWAARAKMGARAGLVLAGLALGVVLTQPVTGEFFAAAPAGAILPDAIPSVGEPLGDPVLRVYSCYFCPACRRQEPVIHAVVDEVIDRSRIVFCDLPTHGTISKKYIAYFIACLLGDNEDETLLRARQSLFDLAGEQVQSNAQLAAALRECGAALRLDGEAIDACFRSIRQAAAADGITSTPTVVVENKKGQKRVFKGSFTREELMAAFES
jgi:protein-disulfide isomerase/uncharacterized membrane protein